ncbi:MAG TPA: hypothetical protein VIP46_06220, partial [Pyrinomonadaceae bacterium]
MILLRSSLERAATRRADTEDGRPPVARTAHRMIHVPRSFCPLAFAAVALLALSPSSRAQGWRLVWADEFDGARGAAVDARK